METVVFRASFSYFRDPQLNTFKGFNRTICFCELLHPHHNPDVINVVVFEAHPHSCWGARLRNVRQTCKCLSFFPSTDEMKRRRDFYAEHPVDGKLESA